MPSLSIALVLEIILGLIFIIFILVGLAQGFKKGLFNLCATIVFWILFFTTSNFIINLLCSDLVFYNANVYNLLDSNVGLGSMLKDSSNVTNLMEFLKTFIAETANISVDMLADPAIENTLLAIILSVLKIIYLILFAIVYAILKSIVYAIFFKRYVNITKNSLEKLEKRQAKYVKRHDSEDPKLAKEIEHEKKILEKKNHKQPLLGLCVGTLRGALACFLILSVVNTTLKLLPSLEDSSEKASESETDEGINLYDFILDYLGDDPTMTSIIDMIKDYQSSKLINLTSIKINNQPADELFVDAILSGKSKDKNTNTDYSFAIRKELNAFVRIAEYAFDLTNGFDLDSVKWEALNSRQVEDATQILNLLGNLDLIENLGTVAVGAALSLDQVKNVINTDGINEKEYDIDWASEFKNIATLVSQVYSLGDDLTKLDYFNLDCDKVETLIKSLANLQSINLIGHIGVNMGVNALLNDDETYKEQVNAISESLADLAINKKFGDDIASFSGLYSSFLEIYSEIPKDENGELSLTIKSLTSVDVNNLSPIFHVIFEANFVTELLPNVLEIVRNKIPSEYGSLINPSVVTSTQWENEVDAVLKIVSDITHDDNGNIQPFDKIESYDFSLLKNFTTETVIQSDLLSYALIKLMIDASKSEGLLSKVEGIENYIAIPDSLAIEADSNHKFASNWYSKASGKGELEIMLDTIKNVGSQLESLKYPISSLPAILAAVNDADITSSDVLYYTLDKIIANNLTEYITIPLSATTISEDTINGAYKANILKRSEIKDVIDVLSDSNVIDIEKLFVYYELDENGEITDKVIEKDNLPLDNSYAAKLDTSTSKLISLLTSDKLYDPNNESADNGLNKLFSSSILRASLTKLIKDNTNDILAIPDSAVEKEECLVGSKVDDKVVTNQESVDIIKESQWKALIMAVRDLDIDLDKLINSGDDLDVSSLINCLKDENTNDIKANIPRVFGANGYDDIKYSGILHGTLSKYLIDFANDNSGSIAIIIPSEVKEDNLITSDETISLIRSLTIIGVDALLDDSASSDSMINDIITNVINDDRALDSIIIRATLTNYVDELDTGISIPTSSYSLDITSKNVVEKVHFTDLLSALKDMKEVREDELNKEISYSDLLDTNNITISMLTKTDGKEDNPISKSLILRGIFKEQLLDNDISIPLSSYESNDASKEISILEAHSLISALGNILNASDAITALNVDNITISKITSDASIASIQNSSILKNLITEKLADIDDVIIPSEAKDEENIITSKETKELLSGLASLITDKEVSISDIDLDDLKIKALKDAKEPIKNSYILRATITKLMKDQDSIVIPASSYDSNTSSEMITEEETNNMIEAVTTLFEDDEDASVNNLDIDKITLKTIASKVDNITPSVVIRATLGKYVKDVDDIVIPDEAYENKDENLLSVSETKSLITTLDALFDGKSIKELQEDDKVFDNLTIRTIIKAKNSKDELLVNDSYILRMTIADKVATTDDSIAIPTNCLASDLNSVTIYKNDSSIDHVVNALSKEELTNLLYAIDKINEDKDGKALPLSDFNTDNITISKLVSSSSYIANSYVMRATLTSNISDNDDILIPSEALENGVYNSKNNLELTTISQTETTNLILVLSSLFGSDEVVTNLNVDDLTVGKVAGAKLYINESYILRTTISSKISDVDSVAIPINAIDSDVSEVKNTKTLKNKELNDLLDIFASIGADSKVNDINADDITIKTLVDSKAKINDSYIMRATLAKNLKDNDAILVANEAYEASVYDSKDTSKEIATLSNNETNALITALAKLFNEDEKIDNLNVDNFTFNLLYNARNDSDKLVISDSLILRTTISDKVTTQSGVLTPDAAIDNDISALETSGHLAYTLKESEIENIFASFNTICGNKKVTEIDIANDITVKALSNAKASIKESLIMRASITDNINGNSEIILPIEAYELADADLVEGSSIKVLTSLETDAFVDVLNALFNENSSVSNLDAGTLTIKDINDNMDDIVACKTLHATISNKISAQGEVITPDEVFDLNNEIYISATNSNPEFQNFFKAIGLIFDDSPVSDLSDKLGNSDSFVDDLINKYDGSDYFASLIFRATTSRFMMTSSSFNAFTIERDDLGTEIKEITGNDDYLDGKIDVITNTEFSKLILAMKKLKTATGKNDSITSLFASSSPNKLSFKDLKICKDDLIASDILRKELSKQIKDEFASAGLTFLNNLYYGKEVSDKLYIDSKEMNAIFEGISSLGIDNVKDMDLDISSDSSFIYSLSDDNIKAICDSTIISYNIRKSLINANNGYFNHFLALSQEVPEDISEVSKLTGNDYIYSTTNSESESDICTLVKAVVSLKNNNFLSIITTQGKSEGTDIATFKDSKFILTITNDNILRDSIPNLLSNISTYNESSTFNLATVKVPDRGYADKANGRVSHNYMRGLSNDTYTSGEFYKFIDAISNLNKLSSGDSDSKANNLQVALASDLAYDTIDTGLMAIDNTVGDILATRYSAIENYDMVIGDGSSVANRKNYPSTTGQNFLKGIASYL